MSHFHSHEPSLICDMWLNKLLKLIDLLVLFLQLYWGDGTCLLRKPDLFSNTTGSLEWFIIFFSHKKSFLIRSIQNKS